jgi:hypothetical protein
MADRRYAAEFRCIALSFRRWPVAWRLGQGKEHDLLSGHGTDVVVQAQHFDARDLMDHCFHDRPRRFSKMGPHLFQQAPPLLDRVRHNQVQLGRGQNTLKTDHDEVAEQVDANIPRPSSHVFLFKPTDVAANGRFDLALGFHGGPRKAAVLDTSAVGWLARRDIS